MKLVELECPNCGAALKKTEEKLAKCPHCGTEFIIDEGQPENVTNIYHAPQKSPLPAILLICILLVGFLAFLVQQSSHEDEIDYEAAAYVNEEKKEVLCSPFFDTFIQKVYGAPYEKVSEKELTEITYMSIFWQNHTDVIAYARNDGEIEQIEMSEDLQADYTDISKFKGLKTLILKSTNVPVGALDGLDNLTEIWSYSSPLDLAELMAKPENITILGCYDAPSLTGIEKFSNLERLYVSDSDLSDIGALSAVKNLKSLEIAKSGEMKDFGVLHGLTNLEVLSMDAEGLKEISFVKNMENLQELALKDTIILDVSALEGKTSLKKLVLEDNRQIEDFSALSSLTGLESLELELNDSAQMPDTSGWSNLTSLSIRGTSDIGFLANLPNLKILHLAGADCSAFGVLPALQNLEELSIGNIYGDLDNLNMLTGLSKLKKLDISAVTVYGNVEAIFSIPSLEELNISDSSFGLDFASVPENKSLKRLYMNRMQLWTNISVAYDGFITYADYDEVSFADEIGFLAKFPNLEEIYLQGNKLSDVTFAEGLPNLKKLDITDNYVTDLRPLANLKQLETVWCGENSISQGTDLGEDVTVILNSEADEGVWWK
ncbi:MAG: leucine-rich repeat domain-containing protein [Lachnospiraceae bacterium]|nr:leucine-rich repeat domain-containing protein [Lachnospiraceae bacterium]